MLCPLAPQDLLRDSSTSMKDSGPPEPQPGASGTSTIGKVLQLLYTGFNALTLRAGPSSLAPTSPQAHGPISANNGDVNIAGGDVHTHKHYHSYFDRTSETDVLGAHAKEGGQSFEAFPSIAEDFYRQIWCRILEKGPHHVMAAKALLVWVLNASSPLTLEALEHAVTFSSGTYQFDRSRFVPGMLLISLCAGLLILDEESRLVQLVHDTARDTLQGLVHDSFPHPHSYLAMACVRHLAGCGFQNTTIRREREFNDALRADRLLAYASGNWATHAQHSLDVEPVKREIAAFVRESKALPAFPEPGGFGFFDILQPLHILAVYNLPMALIPPDEVGDPNVLTKIKESTPLTLAAWHSNEPAVAFLLAQPDIQVNLEDKEWCSALLATTVTGHQGIAKLLLAHPEVEVGISCALNATHIGHEGIAQLLLAHPDMRHYVCEP